MQHASRRPSFGRDSVWLSAADIIAVFLALVGQLLLARALLAESYGLLVIALDLFATLFLLLDLGLPTLLARDGPRKPSSIWSGMIQIYRLQIIAALVFAPLACGLVIYLGAHDGLMLLAAVIALVHIASYAPRTALRASGDARFESITKVVERGITTAGYGLLYVSSSTNVVWYALVFLVGASIGCLLALWGAYRVSNVNQDNKTDFKELGSIWENKKSLLIAALPFAITLGVLPYVIRIEKFILSVELGLEEVALFHVAQLAWLAGLLIPQAMRAALLPVLGASRDNKELFNAHLNRVESIAFGLVPIGLVSGAGIVTLLLPVAFPSEYFDGSLGASAQDIFMLLLAGWAMTVLSVPSYTSLQAGNQPWRFTGLIALVVIMATLIGWFLIRWGADKDAGFALEMAAYASVGSTFIMLFAGIGLSQRWKEFKGRGLQWIFTIGLVFVTCYAFSERSWWALSGLPLFILLPQALEAMRTTVGSQTLERTSEAE